MGRKVTSSAFEECRNSLGKRRNFSSIFLRYNIAQRMKFHFQAEIKASLMVDENKVRASLVAAENATAPIHRYGNYCDTHCTHCIRFPSAYVWLGLDGLQWGV